MRQEKKKERLGWIEEKGQQWRFYCIARLVNTCQSVNTNNLKGITATPTFVEHGEQTLVENCTPVTKWKWKRVNGLTSPCLCGT